VHKLSTKKNAVQNCRQHICDVKKVPKLRTITLAANAQNYTGPG